MLKLDMTSEIFSKPKTIINNKNIFKKYIYKTKNNENTTCLDLAFKKISIDTYISSLGNYNYTNFTNVYNPEQTSTYTYTDYSQQCPDGWSEGSDGGCSNWWNYNGTCPAGQYESGYQNCNWVYVSQTCGGPVAEGSPTVIGIATQENSVGQGVQSSGNGYSSYCDDISPCFANYRLRFSNGVVSNMIIYSGNYPYMNPDVSFALENIPANGVTAILQGQQTSDGWWWTNFDGDNNWYDINVPQQYVSPDQSVIQFSGTTSNFNFNSVDYNYECGSSQWQCEPYTYQLPASYIGNSNSDKQTFASNCGVNWPQATGTVTTPAYYTCNINTILQNSIAPIGIIPISEDPSKYAIYYIFKNNILPNQDAYFAYYSDGTNYNIFVSNTTNATIFTNQGAYDSNQTNICQGVNSSFTNYPVSVFKLSAKIYNDGNFLECSKINNSNK